MKPCRPTDHERVGMDFRNKLLSDGYFVVRGVLSAENIRIALDRLREISAHIANYEGKLPWIVPVKDERLANHEDALYHHDWLDWITFRDEVLWREVAAHPTLLEIARAIVGPDVYILNGGGVFLKPPGSPAGVPWHQDASPFHIPTKDGHGVAAPLFDFWLGLTESTADMGPLRLIPGSQHRGRLQHIDDKSGLLPRVDPPSHGYSYHDVVTVETGPGDLLVWHQDMIHGSEPNTSSKPRIAVASIYHGAMEEQSLRLEHRKGAIKAVDRVQFCSGETILPCPDPIPATWEMSVA